MENQNLQNKKNGVAKRDISDEKNTTRIALQNFITILNRNPTAGVEKTPDGKAWSLGISHIETTLDELFFGLWSTENFKWAVIANEVVGTIDLIVTHPVTGKEIRRSGAAAIIIQVNKGANALDVSAKKTNALDLGFPKLKAECLKNAAQSLGKLFGRDLNRTNVDTYNPIIKETVN